MITLVSPQLVRLLCQTKLKPLTVMGTSDGAYVFTVTDKFTPLV